MSSRLKKHSVFICILLALLMASAGVAWQWQASRPEPLPDQPTAVDIGFVQSMSLHHHQAISMAQMMLQGAEPTPLQALAQSIAFSQLRELGKMEGWLRLWQQNLLPKRASMTWMLLGKNPPSDAVKQYLLDCKSSPTGMSGLATMQELEALRRLTGKARDREFLKLMLAHHEGGLPMAQFAAHNAQVMAVRELAQLIVMEQAEEILRMRRTLAAIAVSSQ